VDDRIGAFIALEAARRAAGSDVEVVALCSTREEIGCVGAMPGTYGVDPDEAIAIDVTWTSDVPGDHAEDTLVGKGPSVTFGAATRARIGRELVEIAEAAGIDIQLSAAGRYTATDADTIVRAGRGVPVGVVSVPTRYLHSPGELFALEDAEASIDLLTRWATRER
ncbi:MAG: peptidase family protein, partial [Thermoleophilia bacterium]|nr:peptidase family protein [Thermoleophilia bacterium]